MSQLLQMLIVVTSPPGSDVPISAWLNDVAAVFEARAQVDVRSSEQAGVDAAELESCPARARFACWTALAQASGARFLLMVSVVPLGERQQVGAYAFDLIDPAAQEDELARRAIRVEPIEIAGDRSAAIEHIFSTVAPGLKLEAPLAIAAPPLEPAPVETSALRIATIAGGGVVAASGIALVIVGIARAAGGQRIGCIGAGECPRAGSPSFGYDGAAGPSTSIEEVEPGGVRIAPLGASLLLGGTVISLGTLLFGATDEVPWIQILTGLAAGAVLYPIVVLSGGA